MAGTKGKGQGPLTTALTRDELEEKLAQAYQVIGTLLGDRFETEEGQRVLDYFGRDEFRSDFLSWPRDVQENQKR